MKDPRSTIGVGLALHVAFSPKNKYLAIITASESSIIPSPTKWERARVRVYKDATPVPTFRKIAQERATSRENSSRFVYAKAPRSLWTLSS
jgi:hypothetical protein